MELYFHVFNEGAWKASIVPLGNDATYFAMLSFGSYSMLLPWLVATLGAAAGQSFNWCVGRALLHFHRRGTLHINPEWYERSKKFFGRYGIFLLVLTWIPLLNFITVAAGLLNFRFRTTLFLTALGALIHYGVYLL